MLIENWTGRNYATFSVLRDKKSLKNIQDYLSAKSKNTSVPALPGNYLIPIKVVPVSKGKCSKFGIICVPYEYDIKEEPVEPNHRDGLAQKRKKLRLEHKNLLQRLRRRRKRAKENGQPIAAMDVDDLRKHHTEMRKLWLPEPEEIKSSCSRPVIGFIKHGAFSFTEGRSKGLGYIVADSLNALANSPDRNKVLIRNTNSRQYHLAVLEVLVE